jgi:hypothetical protein
VLIRIPQLSMLVTTVWRLAGELRKTQRRVNALQHIFIPNYEATVAFIVSSLEEREREEIFRLKWLKTKLNKQAEAKAAERRQRSKENELVAAEASCICATLRRNNLRRIGP